MLIHKAKAKIDDKKYRLKVYLDDHANNPREEYNHLGTLLYCGDYNLGGDNDIHATKDEIISSNDFNPKKDVWLPVYIYDHSGITLSTSPFSCAWDSGQIGFIFCKLETIRKECRRKRITKKIREIVKKSLQAEIEELDNFVTGNIYFFNLEEKVNGEWETVDSCGGIIGDFKEWFTEDMDKKYLPLVEDM